MEIYLDNLKDFENQLQLLKASAYPYATRQTLESTAAHARRVALYNVRNSMVIRNSWTELSIRSTKVGRVMDIDKQEARVGSYRDYMETQEFGGVKKANGSKGVPIPTAYAAGQTGKRTRLPRAANTLRQIHITKGIAYKTWRRAKVNAVAVQHAAKTNNRYIYMDLGRRRGLFKIVGSKKKPVVKMLYDLSRRSVVIPARPWLYPASMNAIKAQPEYFYRDIVYQLKKHKIGSFRNG